MTEKQLAAMLKVQFTPTRNFRQGSEHCRELATAATGGGKADTLKGIACRAADGEWVFKS